MELLDGTVEPSAAESAQSRSPVPLLGAAWGCVGLAALLLVFTDIWCHVAGYVLAAVAGLGLVTMYRRASQARIASSGIAPPRFQGASATVVTIAALCVAAAHAYWIGWGVA